MADTSFINSPGGAAAISGGLGLTSGILSGLGSAKLDDKTRALTQQQMLVNLLTQQQQQAMQASQLNPYTQLQAGQNMAMRGELMPSATNASYSFDPATGMGHYTGGMQIPQGGFSAATNAMYAPAAQQSALSGFQQATGGNNDQLNNIATHLAGASGMTQAPAGMQYDSSGNLQKKGAGFLGTLGKIAGVALPIAAMAIPGVGPVLGAAMMAGGGAAAGAANGGLKGALLGGAAGAASGAAGSVAGKLTSSPLLQTAIKGGIGAAAGGLTGGLGGAVQGGGSMALASMLANRNAPSPSVQGNVANPGINLSQSQINPQSAQLGYGNMQPNWTRQRNPNPYQVNLG